MAWNPRNLKNKSVHQIDWNLIIPHLKYGVLTTFLSVTFQILILEYRYCYFVFLQRLGCWKMYRNSFQDVLEAEKCEKQKLVLFLKHPVGAHSLYKWSWQAVHMSGLIISTGTGMARSHLGCKNHSLCCVFLLFKQKYVQLAGTSVWWDPMDKSHMIFA